MMVVVGEELKLTEMRVEIARNASRASIELFHRKPPTYVKI